MSKYGRVKYAFFEDGVVIGSPRRCDLKRAVALRRWYEGYHGRVHFRPETDRERYLATIHG